MHVLVTGGAVRQRGAASRTRGTECDCIPDKCASCRTARCSRVSIRGRSRSALRVVADPAAAFQFCSLGSNAASKSVRARSRGDGVVQSQTCCRNRDTSATRPRTYVRVDGRSGRYGSGSQSRRSSDCRPCDAIRGRRLPCKHLQSPATTQHERGAHTPAHMRRGSRACRRENGPCCRYTRRPTCRASTAYAVVEISYGKYT